jgi:3'-5' exoribonuclease
VSAIADLQADRVVEGVYAVAKKERRRTRTGSDYLALELVDPSGRIEARVWSDVELLDGRFGEGDAVRVLGRVDKYRDRLQVAVRSLEPAEEDVATLTPGLRRDADELDGFLEFLGGEIAHPGLKALVERFLHDELFRGRLRELPASPDMHHDYAGGLLEHAVAVGTICRDAAQVHPRLRADLLVAAALLHDAGRTVELGRAPTFRPTDEGRLLGHVQLGIRLIESRAEDLDRGVLAELVHAVAVHHDARAARTAEAAVLYHANQLDAVAATRPVPD